MTGYVRPAIPQRAYVDADGNEFRYGHRWFRTDGPPDSAYSHDSHPERFAPLHDVADALVEHLTGAYDVRADADPPLDGTRFGRLPDHSRALRLVPARDGAAPLTFVWTDYPGLVVLAGALASEHFPVCGCDACDEEPERLAEDVEELVFGVVEGRLREWVQPLRQVVGQELTGRGSSWGPQPQLPRTRLHAVARRLRLLPDGRWQAWPARDVVDG